MLEKIEDLKKFMLILAQMVNFKNNSLILMQNNGSLILQNGREEDNKNFKFIYKIISQKNVSNNRYRL